MPTIDVMVAIMHANRILLIQREDFEVWGLPSGMIEAGESLAQAAVREAREETGLDVRLTRVIGLYSRPDWVDGGDHSVLFAAIPIAGVLLHDTDGEVINAAYFDRHTLPEPLIWWHRQRIEDALAGRAGTVAWTQKTVWPFEDHMPRSTLYEQRDKSGLSRQRFYIQHFQPEAQEQRLDVGEDKD